MRIENALPQKIEGNPENKQELEITGENKEQVLKELYIHNEPSEEWEYKYDLYWKKNQAKEEQGTWQEELGDKPEGAAEETKKVYNAMLKSDINQNIKGIYRHAFVSNEMQSAFDKLSPVEKKEIPYTVARRLIDDIEALKHDIYKRYHDSLKDNLREGMSVNEAVEDYNKHADAKHKIGPESVNEIEKFYDGRAIEELIDAQKDILPSEIIQELKTYFSEVEWTKFEKASE